MEAYAIRLVVLAALASTGWILDIIFSALSGIGNNAIFISSVGNVSAKYETEITPATYAFLIWNVIFIWNAAWIVYAITGFFRTTPRGPVFLNPVVFNTWFYVSWILNNVLYIAWLLLWDREYLLLAFIALLAITLTGFSAFLSQVIATSRGENELRKSRADLISVYLLAQNGTAVYIAWTTVATMLNLSIAITYDPMVAQNLSDATASTIALSILAVTVIVWSVLENTILFRQARFVYSWYGVLIWALSAVLVKNYEPSSTNSVLTIVLLCITIACLAIKIAVYFCKMKGRVSNSKSVSPLELNENL